MNSDISNSEGPVNRASQLLGQAEEEDAVISLVLKKEYCDIDESSDNRLLWKSHVEKVIKSGTLTRLVQQLAPHGEELDHSYRTIFLAVYRTFATPAELLQELILRFNRLQTTEDKKFKDSEICITLRSILSFIRLWLEKYIVDFNNPPSYDLLTQLEEFLTQQTSLPMIANETSELLRHVLELRQKLMSGDLVPVNGNGTTEERAIDDLYDWLSFKPVQIAWDLTALDADMFGSLVPHQCLHYIRHHMDLSPSIYRSIEHFNKVICLVITTVLQPSISRRSSWKFSASYDGGLSTTTDDSSLSDSISGDEHDRSDSFPPSDSRSSPPLPTPASYPSSHVLRGRCMSHWIDVAQQCRLLKNFSSLKAIVFGLQSSSVSRLHHSWSTISNERQIIFEELLNLFSSDSNFQIFREVLNKEATGKRADVQSPYKKSKLYKHKTGPSNTSGPNDVSDVVIGVIPYLGTFLSDLTMIHTALPDRNKDGQINFEKRRKEFEILAKISLFQTASSKYNLPKNPSLYHWIYHTPLLTEDESYQLSVELEPPLLSPVDKSPFSSPRSVKSSSPLCESIIRRSLRLLKNTGKHVGKKTGALSVPSDPRLRKSFDSTASDIESDLDEGGAIYRSSSCFELNERVIIRVSISEHENVCKYKSIYLSKSDHTSKVIQASLEKYGLPVEEANKYQLSQQLQDGLSVIPEGACVYYALDNTRVLPDLYIKLIKDSPPSETKTIKAKSNRN